MATTDIGKMTYDTLVYTVFNIETGSGSERITNGTNTLPKSWMTRLRVTTGSSDQNMLNRQNEYSKARALFFEMKCNQSKRRLCTTRSAPSMSMVLTKKLIGLPSRC